jgi:two-component system, NtrC family, sensor kinase
MHKKEPGTGGPEHTQETLPRVAPDKVLRALLPGSWPNTDDAHFLALVQRVAEAFDVTSAVLVRPLPGQERFQPLAVWSRGQSHEEPPFAAGDTVLREVLLQGVLHCPEGTQERFPEDAGPRKWGARGFLGVALRNAREEVLGILALLHEEPLEVVASDLAFLDLFAMRASSALERIQARSEVEQAHDFLRKVLDAIQDPIFVKDREHRWVAMNEAFCRFARLPEESLLGKSDYDVVPAHQADVFWKKDELVFTTGQPNTNEESLTDAAHVHHTVITHKTAFTHSNGQPFLVGVMRDISEQRRLEAKLRLSDRMATVGTMAASVAHEINNPLSYVGANLSYLHQELSREDAASLPVAELREAVSEALEGTARVRTIVRDMKTFARVDDERAGPVDIHEVIGSAQRMVRHQMNNHARCVLELEPLPPVLGNPARLIQVLVNLMVNALQAFSHSDPHHNRVRIAARLSEQGQVLVEVEDNGTGMTPEVLARLFDPFFTTKPAGEGTGLGLNICQSIIHAMGGRIEVTSTPRQGSTFRLVLPRLTCQETAPGTARGREGSPG